MPSGYADQILRVDLHAGQTKIEQPGTDFYRHYWGGRGFIAYYLLKETPVAADPLGPDNLLIFATGVLTGGPFGGSGRHSIGARSPLTGAFGESEVGGYWGTELKKAGFDAIVIQGCSPRPVYLWIHEGQAEIRNADHLWGLTTAETKQQILAELTDPHIRLAMIGPAGEHQVKFASIMHDLNYAAGRTGMGAVMGSKNLKAIAVRGRENIQPAKADIVRPIGRWLSQSVETNPGLLGMRTNGTAGLVNSLNALGALPTRNFQSAVFDRADDISGEKITETILTRRASCFACPIQCKRVVRPSARHPFDPQYGGPEYETIAAFGSNVGVSDLDVVIKANALCSAYGLDTISTGATIAFALECFERGILSKEQSDGLDLRFGCGETVLELIERIASRKGIGDLLAEGTRRAAKMLGGDANEYAMHVMGLEVAFQEPRLAHHRGLGYVVGPTGADHLVGAPETFFEKEGPRLENYRTLGVFQPSPLHGFNHKKLRLYVYSHIWYSFANCAVLCLFVPYSFEQVRQLVVGMTGWNSSLWEIMKGGERAATMARAYNIREGAQPQGNTLPRRFFKALQEGPLAGVQIDPDGMEEAKRAFNGMMGWDPETGVPTIGKLQELGIEWVASCLY